MIKLIKLEDIPKSHCIRNTIVWGRRQKDVMEFWESGAVAAEVSIGEKEIPRRVASVLRGTIKKLGVGVIVVERAERVFLVRKATDEVGLEAETKEGK